MKDTIANLLLLICFIGILFGGCVVTYFLIIDNINSCTSNPLKYYADKIVEENNLTYEYISFNIYTNRYDLIPAKSVQIDLEKSNYPIKPILK